MVRAIKKKRKNNKKIYEVRKEKKGLQKRRSKGQKDKCHILKRIKVTPNAMQAKAKSEQSI